MKKRVFKWMLMAAVVLGLSWNVTACKDDDDEKNSENEELKAQDPYAKNGDVASALFRVVGPLAELDSLPDNWKSVNFEPTKGKVLDASKPLVRSLAVANLAEAVSLFRTLTGQNIPDDATSAQWSKDGVGSLTFTATNSSAETAVIDVNIKQMPKLTQLRLVPASALGENGSFTGNPYYHIGDVVKDGDGRHWICVRSAYSPAGKEDTHWVTMQILTSDSKSTKFKSNVRTINAKAGKNGLHKIQQKLGNSEDTKHLKYFAQLMYLLNNPSEYANNYARGEIMEYGLGDLGVAAHKNTYVERLAKYWNNNNIWDEVLPATIDGGKKTKGSVTKDYFKSTEGFIMLYYGHDFSALGMGSDCTIYTCQMSGKCLSTQTEGKKTWTYNSTENTKFDCTDFALKGEADPEHTNAGYTGKAIVVVQASGKQLNGGTNPGPTNRISKCTDVLVGTAKGFDKETPGNNNDEPKVGYIVNDKGDVYANYEDARTTSDYQALAMIVYIGNGKQDAESRVDESSTRRYLAVTLESAIDGRIGSFSWGPITNLCGTAYDQDKDYTQFIGTKNGLAFTETLCGDSHNHPAAIQARDFLKNLYIFDYTIKGHNNFAPSNFFLPAAGQWVLAFKGMGVWDFSGNGTKAIETIKALYDKAGVPENKRIPMDGTGIWISTENSAEYGYILKIDAQNGIRFVKEKKDMKHVVYPFILFG